MSATCLTQPTMRATQPVILDDQAALAPAVAVRADALPRVRTLRYVQHPSFRAVATPTDRAWELDARRPLRRHTAA